jgi:hypothetical protein
MFVCALLWVQILIFLGAAAYGGFSVLAYVLMASIGGADAAVASVIATRFGARKTRSDLRKW